MSLAHPSAETLPRAAASASAADTSLLGAASTSQAFSQQPLASPTTSPVKTKRIVRIALATLCGLMLLAAAGSAIWWYVSQRATSERALASAANSAALTPPVAFEMRLAGSEVDAPAIDAAALDQTLARVPLLAQVLQAGIYSAAEQAATGDLVVRPFGRQAVDQEIPRHLRWEIRFEVGSTLESYARQLDAFGIELGLIGGSDQVVYLYNLSKAKPDRRVGPASKDQRLYMTWQRGELREADEQLFARAKVPTTGKIIAQFYPAEAEEELAEAEAAYAKLKQHTAIRKTIFGVTTDNDGYLFKVAEQEAGAARASPITGSQRATQP